MGVTASAARRSREHRFFYAVAGFLGFLVLLGFARTYFLKTFFHQPPLSVLLHVHGVSMTLWFALFGVQVYLAANRRVGLHRKLGYAGLGLAAIVVVVGIAVAIGLTRRELTAHPESGGDVFLLGMLLFSVMVDFVLFIALGTLWRDRPDYHKRAMTLAMLSVIGPAVTRLPLDFLPQHNVGITIAINIGCIVGCVLIDALLHRRLHPVFGWGATFIVVWMFVIATFSGSQTWAHIVRSALGAG